VRRNKQTDPHRDRRDDRYTHATTIGVNNNVAAAILVGIASVFGSYVV